MVTVVWDIDIVKTGLTILFTWVFDYLLRNGTSKKRSRTAESRVLAP